MTGEKKGPEFSTIEVPVFDLQTDRAAYRVREGEKTFVMLGNEKGPEFNKKSWAPVVSTLVIGPDGRRLAYVIPRYDDNLPENQSKQVVVLGNREGPQFQYDSSYALGRPLIFSPDGQKVAYRAKRDGKAFIFVEPPFEELGDPFLAHVTPQSRVGGELTFDEVGDPVISHDGARLAFWAKEGTHWFMRVDTLESSTTAPKAPPVAPKMVSLSKSVPTLTPHLVVVQERSGSRASITPIGGSIGKAFVEFDGETLPWDSVQGEKCRQLGQEWTGGLPFKLYSFDQPLGKCTGNLILCYDPNDYHFPPPLDFTGCKEKDRFSIGVTGSWDALPRIPKVLKNHQEFTPIIRKLLEAHGLKQAPVRIEYVHSVDLDGDGTEERFINARSGKDCGEPSSNDYAVFVMLGTLRGKPETKVISESWGTRCLSYEVERSGYADLNGDGAMELLLFGGSDDGWGLKVKALQASVLVDLPLGYWSTP